MKYKIKLSRETIDTMKKYRSASPLLMADMQITGSDSEGTLTTDTGSFVPMGASPANNQAENISMPSSYNLPRPLSTPSLPTGGGSSGGGRSGGGGGGY